MAEASYSIRGRQIDGQEIEAIRDLIRGNEVLGRTAISRLLCERWHWRQSNGRLKDRACRVLLLALENKGVIKLPAQLRVRESFNRRGQTLSDRCEIGQRLVSGKVSDFRSLTIEMVPGRGGRCRGRRSRRPSDVPRVTGRSSADTRIEPRRPTNDVRNQMRMPTSVRTGVQASAWTQVRLSARTSGQPAPARTARGVRS